MVVALLHIRSVQWAVYQPPSSFFWEQPGWEDISKVHKAPTSLFMLVLSTFAHLTALLQRNPKCFERFRQGPKFKGKPKGSSSFLFWYASFWVILLGDP
jgi:hypothetical protein